MELHTIDYVIIGVIALSVITGLFRGFVKELIALCVWIVAIWLSFNYASLLNPLLTPYIHDNTVRTVVSFGVILVGVVLSGALLNAGLSFILQRTGLSGTDRMLGMVFGAVRGVFIVALGILLLNMTSISKKEEYTHQSMLYSKFDPVVNWLATFTSMFLKQAKMLDDTTSVS